MNEQQLIALMASILQASSIGENASFNETVWMAHVILEAARRDPADLLNELRSVNSRWAKVKVEAADI